MPHRVTVQLHLLAYAVYYYVLVALAPVRQRLRSLFARNACYSRLLGIYYVRVVVLFARMGHARRLVYGWQL